jgi:hypothetical protein
MLVFHSIVVPDTNFEPLTVKVKAGFPSVPVLGDTAVKVGAGLGGRSVVLVEAPPHDVSRVAQKQRNTRANRERRIADSMTKTNRRF